MQTTDNPQDKGHPLRRALVSIIAGAAGVAVAALTGVAAAKPPTTLGVAQNSTIGKTIVVDRRGLTVYELRPETAHHLLCTQANGCFRFWSPVKVASAKTMPTAVTGINGKLGILHRNGFFQVTLAGHPLYRFAGDRSEQARAAGQGIHSFGGTWHVIVVHTTGNTTTPTTPTTPTTTTTTTTPTTTTTMIPQGDGGDHDLDNNGFPSDGDGDI